jgi:hypothetical protein
VHGLGWAGIFDFSLCVHRPLYTLPLLSFKQHITQQKMFTISSSGAFCLFSLSLSQPDFSASIPNFMMNLVSFMNRDSREKKEKLMKNSSHSSSSGFSKLSPSSLNFKESVKVKKIDCETPSVHD